MCIAISLPGELKSFPSAVELQIIECARFLSEEHRALISFDIFVRNQADQTIDLLCTHLDAPDVILLATDDYFDEAEQKDERAVLVGQVYGDSWTVDAARGEVKFCDPIIRRFNPDESEVVSARAMNYALQEGRGTGTFNFAQIAESCLDLSRGARQSDRANGKPGYWLKDVVAEELRKDGRGDVARRPFSTVRVGPFPPVKDLIAHREEPHWTFFRLTIELRGETYNRLIGDPPTVFEMMSSGWMIRCLDNRFSRATPTEFSIGDWDRFRRYFDQNIRDTEIKPALYQIVLAQPRDDENNRYVQVRPTSSQVVERYIRNDEARSRAKWFHSDGQEFSLVLKYGAIAAHEPGRFRDPVPVSESVPYERSSLSPFEAIPRDVVADRTGKRRKPVEDRY